MQQEFLLENAIDPFSQRVLIAVIAVRHRTDKPVFLVNGLVLMGAVLDATIGMMNQRLLSLAPPERHLQGLTDLRRVQTVMNVIADDLPRVGIRHQTQIGTPPSGGQIGDICNPNLLAPFRSDLSRPRFQQIGMTPETMVAVRRLVIRPTGLHQQAIPAQ